jgi:hypothetical protein
MATPVLPTPAIVNLFVWIPALYVPSIPEEVVDNPETEIISRFSKLWGLSAKIKYSPLDSPG